MDKFVSHRKSGKILAAAAASVGLLSWASPAKSSLLIDLRVTNTGTSSTRSNVNHNITVPSVGFTVTMGVYAKLTGLTNNQISGDFDLEGDNNDLRNDEGLQILNGSFQSVGGLLGNMNTAAGAVGYNAQLAPYNDTGSQNGLATDWDSDGDLDIGTNGTDPTNMWIARTGSPGYSTLFDTDTDTDNFPQSGIIGKGWSKINNLGVSKGAGANTEDTIIDANTSEQRIGTIKFIVTNLGNGAATLNYVRRPVDDPGAFLWFEDGSPTGKYPGSGGGTLTTTGVNVSVAPEPGTIGLRRTGR